MTIITHITRSEFEEVLFIVSTLFFCIVGIIAMIFASMYVKLMPAFVFASFVVILVAAIKSGKIISMYAYSKNLKFVN